MQVDDLQQMFDMQEAVVQTGFQVLSTFVYIS
jgi:hypothetical protein